MFTFLVGALSCAFGMPLEDVSFVVDVDGPLAEVLIEQTFRNDADVPIEAVYAFPLHEEAAVDRHEVQAGEVVGEDGGLGPGLEVGGRDVPGAPGDRAFGECEVEEGGQRTGVGPPGGVVLPDEAGGAAGVCGTGISGTGI